MGDGILVGAVQAVGEILELGREQVTIPVEAHLNTGVAEVLTDRFRAGALGDEQTDGSMSEVVDSHLGRESGRCQRRLPDSTMEVAVPEGRAQGRRENQGFLLGSDFACHVPRQSILEEGREQHRPSLIGLRRTPMKVPADIGQRFRHLDARTQ